MKRSLPLVGLLLLATTFVPLHGQTPLPPHGPTLGAHPVGVQKTARPRQTPCWEEAGISKSAMEQRRQIQENTRSQVQTVCADSALSLQQKQQRIREIRQQARQESEALITPQQQEAVKACQQSRASANPHPGIPHAGHGAGPCGEMPAPGSAPPKEPPQNEEPQ